MTELEREKLDQAIAKELPRAVALSNALYDEPEVAYEEVKSSQRMVELLKSCGFSVEYPFLERELGYPTAYRATLRTGEGPKVAILAEYDALPGIGHGCGHNLHGSMAVLAGMALSHLQDQFTGTIQIIGTPAEEANGAKIVMEQEGIFEDVSLAAMIHSHMGGVAQTNMDVLSMRCYEVEFHGLSAHSVAGPWRGHSALAAARKFLDLIDARRECFTPDIFVNTIIQEGGKSPNIIPEYAKLRMEFRTSSRGRLEELDRTVRKCGDAAAMALDCTVRYTLGLRDFWDMVRVAPLEQMGRKLMEERGEKVAEPAPACGSSDMGNVSYQCPAIQMLLPITDKNLVLHTLEMREATRTEQAYRQMAKGASVLGELALTTLNDPDFRNQIYEAFLVERERKDAEV